ncbi:MAG: hypothetical protein JJU15_07905 [Pararhodobacter sp.]|nr:hypothetical protein [Pararhodobacter sp.]
MRGAVLIVVLTAAMQMPVSALAETGDAWSQRKCALYTDAWHRALDVVGQEGISEDFIAAHDAFIAEGCVTRGAVCPVTAQEYRLADILTIAAMNEGMASTFLPFACPG